jgi:putative glycosyltransferase (TIGR04348 family)
MQDVSRLPPRVCIVSPALAAANNGNWQTASRWQRFLAPLYEVAVRAAWRAEDDGTLLIALHARRSAESIERFRAHWPDGAIALVLTGTDLYRDLQDDARARHSLQCASSIVLLQERGLDRLDVASRARARVVVQSAPALFVERSSGDADFVAVGHLRSEKDPQTLWAAARLLAGAARPPTIVHIGGALDRALGEEAAATMASCPAYRWLGAQSHARTRRAIAGARALVHPSRIEGGANAIIEAVRSRVPVLASRIDGNCGLLGADYDGYFATGDAASLATLMRRVMDDAGYASHLAAQCALREPLFRPAAERRAVRALVADLRSTATLRR